MQAQGLEIRVLFGLFLLLMSGVTYCMWQLLNNAEQLTALNKQQYSAHELADDMRRTSDELTRMARTYVVTGDPRFRKYYDIIQEIRDGSRPPPLNYRTVYWDYVAAFHDHQPGYKEPIALAQRIRESSLSEQELSLLNRAVEVSKSLSAVEQKALAMMDQSVSKSLAEPEMQRRSQALLFGPAYHLAKAEVMAIIDKFYLVNEQRLEAAINEHQDARQRLIILAIMGLVLSLLCMLMGFVLEAGSDS